MRLDALFDASRKAPRLAGRGLVRAYRLTLSPLIGFDCRHLPTCSDYADQALDRFGLWAGGWLTLARLLRCSSPARSDLVRPNRVRLASACLADCSRSARFLNRFRLTTSPMPASICNQFGAYEIFTKG